MTFIIFLKIFFVCLLGAMSPGPSMVMVLNNSIFKNRIHGVLTAIGHGIGISIYAVFAVIGIGVIIKTNIIVFNSIQFLSVIFLLYLGLKSIFSKNKINFDEKFFENGAVSFFQGFSISILNPKILIWFIAIYSQFISEYNDLIFNLFLILTAGIVDAIWYISLACVATTRINFLKLNIQILKNVTGCLFLVLGMILLMNIIVDIN